MTDFTLILLFVDALVCGIIGCAVGALKNAATGGFWLGFLLGPIGILIVAIAIDNREKCHRCHGRLDGKPNVCPHCRTEISGTLTRAPLIEDDGLIRFWCSNCGKSLIANREMAGRPLACPKCKNAATVPTPPPRDSLTADEIFGESLPPEQRKTEIEDERFADFFTNSRTASVSRPKKKPPTGRYVAGGTGLLFCVVMLFIYRLGNEDRAQPEALQPPLKTCLTEPGYASPKLQSREKKDFDVANKTDLPSPKNREVANKTDFPSPENREKVGEESGQMYYTAERLDDLRFALTVHNTYLGTVRKSSPPVDPKPPERLCSE